MMQCSFCGCKQKQMSTMVDDDGGLKDLGSVVLGNPQHSNCHLRCLEKTGSAVMVPAAISHLERACHGDG